MPNAQRAGAREGVYIHLELVALGVLVSGGEAGQRVDALLSIDGADVAVGTLTVADHVGPWVNVVAAALAAMSFGDVPARAVCVARNTGSS